MTRKIGYNEQNVTNIELDDGVSAGIKWGIAVEGNVPVFEEHAARIEMKCKLQEWLDMDPMEKAMIIAVRRIEMASKNQQSEAEAKKMKQDAKRAARKK